MRMKRCDKKRRLTVTDIVTYFFGRRNLLYFLNKSLEEKGVLNITICDQSLKNCRDTADILTKILFDVTEVRFTFYENGMKIIDDILEQKFMTDLLFIDVILPGVDGMKVVKFIQRQRIDTDVIFLTEAAEMATEGYRHHAFDFLIKPVSTKRLEETMHRYVEEKLFSPEVFLSVNIRGCNQKIQLQKVLFFESQERKVSAIMADDEIVFYQKLNTLQEQLQGTSFIRCHQSYIVNTDYISMVTASSIILMNKKKIPISKRYSKSVREYILNLQ